MSHFLFEILVEEIPHGVLPHASQYMKEQIPSLLSQYGLGAPSVIYYVTPRRLAFVIVDLPSKTEGRVIEQKGPSVKAAYDTEGRPTKALEGFLKSYQIRIEDIEEIEIKGQKYLFLQKKERGLEVSSILPDLLSDFVAGFKFPQPMRWNHGDNVYEFIRPVRGIVAMLDDQVIPLSFFGTDSSNILHAHRQISPQPIPLSHASDYAHVLKSHACVPSFEERQEIILNAVTKLIAPLKATALLDDELLSILASLTEYPHPLLASFEESFLSLPKEVLISEMKIHQKYIPIVDQQQNLLPYYIITANIPYDDPQTKKNILAGNNRVLKARFADGQFFFEEDSKKGLSYYADQLSAIAFIEGAGSLADKITRMQKIASYLRSLFVPELDSNDLIQAVTYAKADLASLMVGEFPELQGVIGSYYAENQNFQSEVALAIKEHYLPMTSDGEMPSTELSALVGLADRLDNLLTLYAVGKTVTGSRDPYALRRQAIAVIHILLQFQWKDFSLTEFFKEVTPLYTPMMTKDPSEWEKLIVDFIRVRLEGILKSDPYHYQVDTLNAVFFNGIDYLLEDIARAEALQTVRAQNHEQFISLIELSKRIANIIKDQQVQVFQVNLLTEQVEKDLYQEYQKIIAQKEQLSYQAQLSALVNIEKPISAFFDSIMVMTGDEKEINRIALLNLIHQLFIEQADFSKLS